MTYDHDDHDYGIIDVGIRETGAMMSDNDPMMTRMLVMDSMVVMVVVRMMIIITIIIMQNTHFKKK